MKTCLIVDDSRVVRKVIRRIVEGFDFMCEEAQDGQEAYSACALVIPDVILLDWNMPIMNGIEFLKKLRQIPGGDRCKVIFCTTENTIDAIEHAMKAGADEYIMKPFDHDIIESKLKTVGVL